MKREKGKNSKGITLIALVITIIILLILVGVTINAIMSKDGLIAKAGQAREQQKYSSALEKVKLAVLASYGENGKINDEDLKINVNKIDGLEEEVQQITYDLPVKVDGYEFLIQQIGEVKLKQKLDVSEEEGEETKEISQEEFNNLKGTVESLQTTVSELTDTVKNLSTNVGNLESKVNQLSENSLEGIGTMYTKSFKNVNINAYSNNTVRFYNTLSRKICDNCWCTLSGE